MQNGGLGERKANHIIEIIIKYDLRHKGSHRKASNPGFIRFRKGLSTPPPQETEVSSERGKEDWIMNNTKFISLSKHLKASERLLPVPYYFLPIMTISHLRKVDFICKVAESF